MPHKPLQPLASSHRADQFYLFYRITLLQIIRYDNNGRKQGRKEKGYKAHKAVGARVTEKEYAKAVELAETCGLTLSDYIRKCALGQHPRRRLTDKEVEAFAVSLMHGAH